MRRAHAQGRVEGREEPGAVGHQDLRPGRVAPARNVVPRVVLILVHVPARRVCRPAVVALDRHRPRQASAVQVSRDEQAVTVILRFEGHGEIAVAVPAAGRHGQLVALDFSTRRDHLAVLATFALRPAVRVERRARAERRGDRDGASAAVNRERLRRFEPAEQAPIGAVPLTRRQ